MKKIHIVTKILKSLMLMGLLTICINSNAQIMRGTSVLTGDFYARFSTDEVQFGDQKDLELQLIPSFGYFLADNFSLNVGIGVGFNSSEYPMSTGSEKYETLYYYFEPSAKLYKAVTEKFYVNMQFFFLYGLRDNKFTPFAGTEQKTSFADMGAGLRPGFTYFITDKIAMTSTLGTLGYTMSKNKDADTKSGNFVFSFGFNSLYFGLSFYLPRKI